MLYKLVGSCVLICVFFITNAQTDQPFIKLVNPLKQENAVSTARQFIIGSTCKTCSVTINNTPVKVYTTGAFAYELNLVAGDTSLIINANNQSNKSVTKSLSYTYTIPKPAAPVTSLSIERIETFPEGNIVVKPGDIIKFKIKALPNALVTTFKNTVLYEMPLTKTNGMPGIYQGEYVVQTTDDFRSYKFPITITATDGQTLTKEAPNTISVLSTLSADVCLTKGRLAHLEYGLGDDRLGGAKIGYIDSLIPLKIIGKVGTHYKVALTPYRTAYIPDDVVTLAPKGTFAGEALTDKIQVAGDSVYDYVTVALTAKLPYQSMQLLNPSTIAVDVFGATNNTNWITHLQSAKEIQAVNVEQVQEQVFRVSITLKHTQHWGYSIFYKGNALIIKVKQQPKSLSLKNLTIAVDAGHGGSNTGAGGATGVAEKNIALAIALQLQQALQKEGATVIMTRTKEQFFDNKERILFYRDSVPDLLISIHLNSSADPFRASGTSTLYKYIGFKAFSNFIHQRMLQLGLSEYGNIGAFNFMLNSPTEYPNALIETLFLSNLDEEALVLDAGFQQKMANQIVAGIKDFLAAQQQ
ncbi:N-acetylmuramoyl-L-alanine amidase [Ferruginibacter yonginensis]|uniref:N-acetylmuramoyl-L-alanine amidase n=1 Tax=Ferruginibacter yonginensis TaxID=1310416 RepID=A0ABV8QQY4_9BACT